MTALGFVVPGEPKPWARVRGVAGHHFNDPKVEAYKGTVRAYALEARQRAKVAGIAWPMDACYRVEVAIRRSNDQRFDPDRMLSTFCDALCGVLYEDDRQKYVREVRLAVGLPDKRNPRASVLVTAFPTWGPSEALAQAIEEGEI